MAKTTGLFERVPGSGVWWIRWTDHQGKRHLEKAGRRSDAIDLLDKRKREKFLRRELPEKFRGEAPVTFTDLATDALKHSKEQNGERSTEELALKLKIIEEAFAKRPAGGITKKDIQDWLGEQTEEREWSPATRNRYQAAFSLVFRVGIENDKVTVNPASKIKRKAENNDRIRFLTPQEEERLTAVIRKHWPHYLPAFVISLHTGMRASEQVGLQWVDVSFDSRILTLWKTKPGKTRHISLNSVALAEFEALRKESSSTHIFLNTEGDPLRSPRDWFEPAVEKAGLTDYTWHCNRHTYASRLVMSGVDIRTVAGLMGHSTIQMTMRYAHLAPEHNAAAVERLVGFGTEKRVGSSGQLVTKSVTGHQRKPKNTRKPA
jgi:integrase